MTSFQIVHEKLFHMFVVSQDLRDSSCTIILYIGPDGRLSTTIKFPEGGDVPRSWGNFVGAEATPQLITKTVLVPGSRASASQNHDARLPRPKQQDTGRICRWSLSTDPPQPIVGMKTLLYFKVKPVRGVRETCWAHGGTCWWRATI